MFMRGSTDGIGWTTPRLFSAARQPRLLVNDGPQPYTTPPCHRFCPLRMGQFLGQVEPEGQTPETDPVRVHR